jgi:hypothetical protein
VAAASSAISVIHRANYLLDRQLRALEQEFIKVLKDFTGCAPKRAAGAKANECKLKKFCLYEIKRPSITLVHDGQPLFFT